MKGLVKTIGIITLSSIIIGTPLLCGLSFGFNWNMFVKVFLSFGALLFWGVVVFLIANYTT